MPIFRGWGVGKLEDMSREINERDFDLGINKTQLRERIEVSSGSYKLVGNGRSKNSRKGGGVGIFVKQNIGITFGVLDVGNWEASEDIVATKIEYRGKGRLESLILTVCYMSVEKGGQG